MRQTQFLVSYFHILPLQALSLRIYVRLIMKQSAFYTLVYCRLSTICNILKVVQPVLPKYKDVIQARFSREFIYNVPIFLRSCIYYIFVFGKIFISWKLMLKANL